MILTASCNDYEFSTLKCQTILKAHAQGGTLFTRGGNIPRAPDIIHRGAIIHSNKGTGPVQTVE